MKKIYKRIVCTVFLLSFLLYSGNQSAYSTASTATSVKKTVQTVSTSTNVSPVDVVNNVPKYINRNISFTAEFVAFTSLGLDYKPAFRDSTKYIGILVRRPDITTHIIPLSEMKIFITREMAEKNIDIDAGDTIKVEGKVFSDALGDPWVDCTSFTIITKKSKTEDKK